MLKTFLAMGSNRQPACDRRESNGRLKTPDMKGGFIEKKASSYPPLLPNYQPFEELNKEE